MEIDLCQLSDGLGGSNTSRFGLYAWGNSRDTEASSRWFHRTIGSRLGNMSSEVVVLSNRRVAFYGEGCFCRVHTAHH